MLVFGGPITYMIRMFYSILLVLLKYKGNKKKIVENVGVQND